MGSPFSSETRQALNETRNTRPLARSSRKHERLGRFGGEVYSRIFWFDFSFSCLNSMAFCEFGCWFFLISVFFDAYDSHFPGLAGPVLVSGVANGVRVSSGSVEQCVDPIEVLEKATVSSFDHLLPSDADGPAAQQIKQLNTELLMLRRELLGKGVHSSPNSAVAVAPAAARTGKPPSPSSWKDVVSADSSGVMSDNPMISRAESVAGSSFGSKDGANMFSILQQMEDGESQKGVDSGDDLESLPTEEEFVAGLTHAVIVTFPVPKKRGRGRKEFENVHVWVALVHLGDVGFWSGIKEQNQFEADFACMQTNTVFCLLVNGLASGEGSKSSPLQFGSTTPDGIQVVKNEFWHQATQFWKPKDSTTPFVVAMLVIIFSIFIIFCLCWMCTHGHPQEEAGPEPEVELAVEELAGAGPAAVVGLDLAVISLFPLLPFMSDGPVGFGGSECLICLEQFVHGENLAIPVALAFDHTSLCSWLWLLFLTQTRKLPGM
ncbi:hypothetical protein RHMOL_Rhmol02G0286200 [Rhododendron molle]|uniref:Uncharacterized protein n=1 Tax=Rhododendron molle TaxID=49168 RepID=A0ACC0PWJ6_RHOML|nr:hypothetical protein RHMOL_Rhmol02G0286200 [Rhododendron molle]